MNILKTRNLVHLAAVFAAAFLLTSITATSSTNATPLDAPKALTTYYYGVFEDGQLQYTDQIFTNTINDLKAHNLNAILFSNTQPNLSISDRLNFNVVAAPMTPLYANWYPASVPLNLTRARTLIYPLVDSLKNHPSLVAYNIRDDSIPDVNDKMLMAKQVFNERDPNHPAIPLLIVGSLAQEVYNYVDPAIFMAYQFPFKVSTGACQVFNGSKDWIYNLRESFQVKPQSDPNWFVLQAHKTIVTDPNSDPASALRQPSPAELSLQFWEALGEEAKGIYWYIYSSSPFGQGWVGLKDLPTEYATVASLGRTFAIVQPYLARSEKIPDRFKASGSNYISTFKDQTKPDTYYIIAVNQSCSAQSIILSSDYFNGSLKDLVTGQSYSLGASVPFAGGEGKMFQVTNETFKARPPTQANIVQNPSFETSSQGQPTGWSTTDQIQIDTATAHSGKASLRIGPSGNLAYQYVNLAPNTYYYFSYWIKTQNLNDNMVGMRVVETSPDTVYLTTPDWNQSGSNNWVKRVGFFKTAASASTNRVDIVWGLHSGQTFWVDDVTLCRMDQPCPDEYLEERLGDPNPPTSVQGKAASQTQVNLTWRSPSGLTTTLSNYHIYRNNALIGTVSATTLSFTDNSAAACAANQYTVRAYLDGVESKDSSLAAVNTLCDPIMSDGFESGNTKAWTATITDNGHLSVTAASTLAGKYGLQAVISDNNPLYIVDGTPNGEAHFRARFYFDPNSLSMIKSDNFVLLYGDQGSSTPVLQMQLQRPASTYQIRVGALTDDGTWYFTPFVPFSNTSHLLELDWEAASDTQSHNGSLTLWVDQVKQTPVTSINNATRHIDQVQLGAVAGIDSGTRGTIYLDSYASRRFSYIGPDASASTQVTQANALMAVQSLAVTAEVTAEAPPQATAEVTSQVAAGVQVVQASDSSVARSGRWREQSSGENGGKALVNQSGSSALTLTFKGNHVEVGYVGGANFGRFNIEIDGVIAATVDGSAEKAITMMHTSLDVSDAAHTLRVLPINGVVAIRTFSVDGSIIPAAAEEATSTSESTLLPAATDMSASLPLTTEASASEPTLPPALTDMPSEIPQTTEVPTIEVTLPPAVTDMPSSMPQATEVPSVEATLPPALTDALTSESMLTPTSTTTLAPFVLPLYQMMDDGAPLWTGSSGWKLDEANAFGGQGMSWTASANGQPQVLNLRAPIDLGSAQFPHLSFITRLIGSAQAQIQISIDGVSWQTISTVPVTNDWAEAQVHLSAYRGQMIYLQFVWMPADPNQQSSGDVWQIDNLTVADLPPTVSPTTSETVLPTQATSQTVETMTEESTTSIGAPSLTEIPPPITPPSPTLTPTTVASSAPSPTVSPTELPTTAQVTQAAQ